jgi:glycogen debranching enzyme
MDAEPGKVVHEIRTGEMAAIGEVPYARYYGSVDATPLFVTLAGEYLRATGDGAFIATLWPHIRAALDWINEHGDLDGDGFVEYQSKTSEGLNNQGWKDSRDSVFHEDGSLATPPIALCEVQGYVYAAKRAASEIAAFLGESVDASVLGHQAEELRARFADQFWDDRLGLYVLALDGAKRPCRVATSNAGQCLFTGIAREDHAARMIEDMVSARFFSGWGIRTVAADQPRYNPMSYHNGSIWPHDTSLIGAGMARYDRADAAARMLEALFDVARVAELHRMPELFCGFARRRDEGPVRYPVACSPQSWAAGAVFLLLQACLGLRVRCDRREVLFFNTVLPEFLEYLRLRGLRVGPCTVDLVLERSGTDVNVHILHRDPGVRVILTK